MSQPPTPSDIKALGTIMSVWAHPDDETICCAGIMATAVKNGQTVICVTATKGELGIRDAKRWPPEQLGDTRARELAAALDILGIKKQHWLGYADSACQDVPVEEAAANLRRLIDQYQPDTILTFGPDGLTGHQDHRTIPVWVAAATEGTDIAIYHAVQLSELYEKMEPAARRFGWFFSRPRLAREDECDLRFCLPQDLLDKKFDCLRAMPSQYDDVLRDLTKDQLCGMLCQEAFIRAK